jgi:hypothetical protein
MSLNREFLIRKERRRRCERERRASGQVSRQAYLRLGLGEIERIEGRERET